MITSVPPLPAREPAPQRDELCLDDDPAVMAFIAAETFRRADASRDRRRLLRSVPPPR